MKWVEKKLCKKELISRTLYFVGAIKKNSMKETEEVRYSVRHLCEGVCSGMCSVFMLGVEVR